MRQATAFPHPGQLKRSMLLRFTTDHGGLVDRRIVDLSRRLARDAEQEGERVFAADGQEQAWQKQRPL
jgi:hypothetical protein